MFDYRKKILKISSENFISNGIKLSSFSIDFCDKTFTKIELRRKDFQQFFSHLD